MDDSNEERSSAALMMLDGIEQILEAHRKDRDILSGLEYARKGALEYYKCIMGNGPLPTALVNPTEGRHHD